MAKRKKKMTKNRLVRLVDLTQGCVGDDEDYAELSEVVRRYNAHDDLVAACNYAANITEDNIFRVYPEASKTHAVWARELIRVCRAALAKAGKDV